MASTNKITVLGSGIMGNGIAHCFAQHGFEVTLCDIAPSALQKGMETIEANLQRQVKKDQINVTEMQSILSRIRPETDLETAVSGAELVVEAVFEKKEAKETLFKRIASLNNEKLIVASNTSSIPIKELAESYAFPHRFIGMHFFNPVPLMPLVEIVKTTLTSNEVLEKVVEYSQRLKKTPVLVNDYPGFVSNRVLMPMINEAILTLEQGVAGVEEIDTVMMLGMAHPMGPLKLADFIGLDVCLMIMDVLHKGLGEKYEPSALLRKMVSSGYLGVKSGEGFYQWEGKTAIPNPKINL